MWHAAAESLSSFPEVVVTASGRDGYPVSARQPSSGYSGESGEMPIVVPVFTEIVAGPATVLAHYHDEKLWSLRMAQIKGRLERHGENWVFVSTAFTPQAGGQFTSLWKMATSMRRSSRRYLATRGLKRPDVNWSAIKRLHRQAQLDRDRGGSARDGRNT